MEKDKQKTQRDTVIKNFTDIPFSFILKVGNFVKRYNDTNFWHRYWLIMLTIKSQNYDELSKSDIEFIYNINSVYMFMDEFNEFLTNINSKEEQ